ncbi:MAG TPA: hypothetical protein VIL72_03405, partial [Beijerinckiaceae bacterium]
GVVGDVAAPLLGLSDSATLGLDGLLGHAGAPVVGLVGLSYADAIDPFDASHAPDGRLLQGLLS